MLMSSLSIQVTQVRNSEVLLDSSLGVNVHIQLVKSLMNFHPAHLSHSFHSHFPCLVQPPVISCLWISLFSDTLSEGLLLKSPQSSLKLLSLFLHYHLAIPTSMVQTCRIIANLQMLVSMPFVTAPVPWVDTSSLKMLFRLCLPLETPEPCWVSVISLIHAPASLSCLHLSLLALPTPRLWAPRGAVSFHSQILRTRTPEQVLSIWNQTTLQKNLENKAGSRKKKLINLLLSSFFHAHVYSWL